MKLNEFVDKIYCINLKNRRNKKKFIEEQSKRLELDITFFNAIRNKKNPAKGCLESHLSIIQNAKVNNYKRILITKCTNRIQYLLNFDNNNCQPKPYQYNTKYGR